VTFEIFLKRNLPMSGVFVVLSILEHVLGFSCVWITVTQSIVPVYNSSLLGPVLVNCFDPIEIKCDDLLY
jgi:hypothetical protein